MGNTTLTNVLIIDDEPQILKLLSTVLSRRSFKIDTAKSGEEGIKKIESKDYSLIFTDIIMPGISGEQVCNYLRNTKQKKTPIIGMSGTPWLIDHNRFNAFLEKPFSTSDLWEAVEKCLIN